MERFLEELSFNENNVPFTQIWDSLFHVIFIKAYYITLLQRVNVIAAFSETLLFAIHNYLTKNHICWTISLLFEVVYLTIIYLFQKVLAWFTVGIVLYISLLFKSIGGCPNTNAILRKCSMFLAFKAIALPDGVWCMLWILVLVIDYGFKYQKKSVVDLMLYFVVYGMCTVNFHASDTIAYSTLIVSFCYILFFVWISLK